MPDTIISSLQATWRIRSTWWDTYLVSPATNGLDLVTIATAAGQFLNSDMYISD